MKAVILLLICTPLLAIEADGPGVKLTDEDRATLANCATQGGCKVWTQSEILVMLLVYRQQLLDTGAGCRRNSI
jgi:hypothetical protein